MYRIVKKNGWYCVQKKGFLRWCTLNVLCKYREQAERCIVRDIEERQVKKSDGVVEIFNFSDETILKSLKSRLNK